MKPKELAFIGGGIAIAAVAIALAVRSKDAPPAAPQPPAPTATATAAPLHPAEEAAIDAVRVLRAHYPTARTVSGDDFAVAGCIDHSLGYETLMSCYTPRADAIKAAAAKAKPAGLATLSCGEKLETAMTQFITATAALTADQHQWLTGAKARLMPAMAGRNLSAACDTLGKFCDAMPRAYQPKYVNASTFLPINSIECVALTFQCGRREDPCGVAVVADRLGLAETRRPHGHLTVRATGRTIQ